MGVSLNGDRAEVNLIGQMTVGNDATGAQPNGNEGHIVIGSAGQGAATINVTVIGGNATGVKVAGTGNTITLHGGITVDKDQSAPRCGRAACGNRHGPGRHRAGNTRDSERAVASSWPDGDRD